MAQITRCGLVIESVPPLVATVVHRGAEPVQFVEEIVKALQVVPASAVLASRSTPSLAKNVSTTSAVAPVPSMCGSARNDSPRTRLPGPSLGQVQLPRSVGADAAVEANAVDKLAAVYTYHSTGNNLTHHIERQMRREPTPRAFLITCNVACGRRGAGTEQPRPLMELIRAWS